MSSPTEQPPVDALDALLPGFWWSWAALLISIVLAFAAGWIVNERLHAAGIYDDWSLLAGMLPPICLLGLLAWSYFSGRRRMALGVLAAFGSMFAILLLLIAACFGVFGFNGF